MKTNKSKLPAMLALKVKLDRLNRERERIDAEIKRCYEALGELGGLEGTSVIRAKSPR